MTGTPRGYRSPGGMTREQAARLRGERLTGAGRGSSNGSTSGYQSATPAPPPVTWTPDREQRGRRPPDDLYRCPRHGCPVVSASLRVMVAHVRAHEDADAVTAADRRVPDLHTGEVMVRREHEAPCACGCGEPVDGPPAKRFASEACRSRYHNRAAAPATLAVVPAFPAPALPVTVTVRAGLATATATVPAPAAALACACGCGEMFPPWPRPGRRFATELCRKRQARRDERRELAAVRAAAVVPAPRSAGLHFPATGSLATVAPVTVSTATVG